MKPPRCRICRHPMPAGTTATCSVSCDREFAVRAWRERAEVAGLCPTCAQPLAEHDEGRCPSMLVSSSVPLRGKGGRR